MLSALLAAKRFVYPLNAAFSKVPSSGIKPVQEKNALLMWKKSVYESVSKPTKE